MKQQGLEKREEYKYGFTTDIESIKAPKGLNEDIIKFEHKSGAFSNALALSQA